MNQQRTQRHIAALADAAKPGLATTGMLPRRQTEPRRKLSATFEQLGIRYIGHQGTGCNRPNTLNLHQPPGRFVLPG